MDEREFQARLRRIRDDRSHGASELAREALTVAAESARHGPAGNVTELRSLLSRRSAELGAARPSMAALLNLMTRWRHGLDLLVDDLARAREDAAAAADALGDAVRRASHEAAAVAAASVPAGATVMTHSLSSTVRELFGLVRDRGVSAVVTESRPLCEGHALAAILSEWSVPTRLITDAQIGLHVGEADLVVVGADSLLADGSVVNKAGTYPLALVAREAGVPFLVCCESFKRRTAEMGAPDLEEMDAAELGAPGWPHVVPVNVYFDVTPARLVTAWCTEEGRREQES